MLTCVMKGASHLDEKWVHRETCLIEAQFPCVLLKEKSSFGLRKRRKGNENGCHSLLKESLSDDK